MEYRLKDCLEKVIDNRGKNPQYFDKEKYPVIDNVFIKNNYYINDSNVNRYINQETYDNFLRGYVEKDMPIMTLVGSGIGNVGLIKNEKVAIVQNTLGFKTKSILNSKYLYYWFLTKQQELQNFNRGSGQPSIKKTDVENMIIDLPSIEEQHKIVNVLEKIDDKIELNNQINDNLQEFARCQFYNKFNGEKPNSKFNKLVNFKKKVIKVLNKNKDLGYYPIDTLPMNYLILKDCKLNEEAKSSLIEFSKYDILLGAMRVYFHRVCLASNDGITRNTTFVFEPKFKEYLYYALLLIDKDEFIDYANRTSKGTTMPYAVWEALEEYEIYLPELKEVKTFNDMMHPIFEKMIANEKENQVLMRLRNTLLPKLMNGEIDLDKIEI